MSSVDDLLEDLADAPDDEVSSLVETAHFVLMKHPIAAHAAFRALVADGRAFARTPEGAEWKERLAGSELVRRGRSLWEMATGGMLDSSAEVLPSHFVDLVAHALTLPDLDVRLARAMEADSASNDGGPYHGYSELDL